MEISMLMPLVLVLLVRGKYNTSLKLLAFNSKTGLTLAEAALVK
jgi:hypothetical protein